MNVQHGLPLLITHIVNGAVPNIAGIIDDNVEAAELLDREINQRVAAVAFGQVGAKYRGACYLIGGLLSFFGVQIN